MWNLTLIRDVDESREVRIEKIASKENPTIIFTKSLARLMFKRYLEWINFSFEDKGRWCWELFPDLESRWRIVMIDCKSCSVDNWLESSVRWWHCLMEGERRLFVGHNLAIRSLVKPYNLFCVYRRTLLWDSL